jgi:hypothetical protein
MAVHSRDRVAAALVGRSVELERLTELLMGSDAGVVYLHGIPGIGKSALLTALLERLREEHVTVLCLDCRAVEPTEQGFLRSLARSLGQADARVELVPAALARLDGAVIALDHLEVFRLMDAWLRRSFVQELASHLQIVLVSRDPPAAAWFGTGSTRGFHSMQLAPLQEEDARLLLGRLGVGERDAPRLNRIARGHPLALALAAGASMERRDADVEEAAAARVVTTLIHLYLEEVDDPLTRRALEASCVLRRVTTPLLEAMVPDAPRQEAFERLLALPFVEAGPEGLIVHEAVREAIAARLRGAEPARYRECARGAWRQLRDEIRDAAPFELWRYTADMLYLIANPVVREAFFPSGSQPLVVETALPSDGDAIVAISRRHERADDVRLIEDWLREAPSAFSVVRDPDGSVRGFSCVLMHEQLVYPPVADPVVLGWRAHLREQPLARGQVTLGVRRWLDAEHGESACATQAACFLDVKRAYMALRPELRRTYVFIDDPLPYTPALERLGFRKVPPPHIGLVLDFGPGSVDGWLTGLVAAELGIDDEAALDEGAREVVVGGKRVALTPLELGVLRRLDAGAGKVVSRGELLHEVWGTHYLGGSNVVDAVVHTLRRKLEPHGDVVEAVRGAGYRIHPGWRAEIG